MTDKSSFTPFLKIHFYSLTSLRYSLPILLFHRFLFLTFHDHFMIVSGPELSVKQRAVNIKTIPGRRYQRIYVLEHSYEQVDQQNVGYQQVAGHDGWDNPSTGLTGRQGHHHPVLCGDVLPTGGCTQPQNKKTRIQVNES